MSRFNSTIVKHNDSTTQTTLRQYKYTKTNTVQKAKQTLEKVKKKNNIGKFQS